MEDDIRTLPFGHISIPSSPEQELLETMFEDEDWGFSLANFSPPDPGFHQRTYSVEELNEVVNLDCLSEQQEPNSPPTNPFIIHEAEKSDGADSLPVVRPRFKRVVLFDDSD